MFREILDLFKELSFVKIQKAAFLQLALVFGGHLILREVFYTILAFLGQYNVTISNVKMLVTNPIGMILFFLYGFLVIAILHVEFYFLFKIVKGEKLKYGSPLAYLRKIWQLFGGWNLPVALFYLLITLPVLQLVLPTIVTQKLTIPSFIIGELGKTLMGKIGLSSGYLLIFYLNLRLMYTIPCVITKDVNFLNGIKTSWKMSHKQIVMTVFYMISGSGIIMLCSAILLTLLVLVIGGVDPNGSHLTYQTLFLSLSWILLFLTTLITKLVIADFLGRPLGMERYQERSSKMGKRLLSLLTAVSCLGVGIVANQRIRALPANFEQLTIAHRGMVSAGVENSLEALEAAAKNGSDYVEMDIIMTADGQFVVSHDNRLNRLAGLNQKISDLTLKEVEGITIRQGNFTSQLVSFDTYVERAKELGVKLLVELKPTGEEPADYAERFVAKVQELGLIELGYKTMSLDIALMEKINKQLPQIETGYVIPLQFGFFGEENVDFYVIEDYSYRPTLSYQASWMDKKVYVWTINKSERMEHFLQQPIDGIITDYPKELQNIEKRLKRQQTLFDRVLRVLQEKF